MSSSSSSSSYPLLTRNEILDVAKTLSAKHGWSLKMAVAVLQNRLYENGKFREAELAYELLDELVKDPVLAKKLEEVRQ